MKINGQLVTPISSASLLALPDGQGSLAAVNFLRNVGWDDAGVLRGLHAISDVLRQAVSAA